MDFYQKPPVLKNTYTHDPLLAAHIKKVMPTAHFQEIETHLQQCGELAVTKWLEYASQAETELPKHTPFSAWGRRIDHIEMSAGWKALEAEAARHGIVAAGYERKYGEYSRIYQMALLYLFHSSSAFVSCPLAMTDGAARALELYGSAEQKKRAFRHLTSRKPEEFWTSGQWMTERTGGSDVSGTSTLARQEKDEWSLEGIKWFTSATTSQMALLLARTEGAAEGSRGLSLFYTELRDKNQKLQNIEILRLKDKLGTKALATAELKLNKTPAEPVGELGGGVKKISSLFNITRIYNSVCATSHMRRALDLAQDYSAKRNAFGRPLIDLPLHKSWVDHLENEWARCFKLTFFVAGLLGKDETGQASENEKLLLRGLTPIVKLYTAKKCLQVTSEVVEIFGGAGYCEDTGIPKLFRDAQVFSIWEGATNVLALDFLRAVQKEGVLQPVLEKANNVKLNQMAEMMVKDQAQAEVMAREFCFLVGDSLSAAL